MFCCILTYHLLNQIKSMKMMLYPKTVQLGWNWICYIFPLSLSTPQVSLLLHAILSVFSFNLNLYSIKSISIGNNCNLHVSIHVFFYSRKSIYCDLRIFKLNIYMHRYWTRHLNSLPQFLRFGKCFSYMPS